MRLADGQAIGQALLANAYASNPTLTLLASRLPTRGGTTFVLWLGGDEHATKIGWFMVDPHGSCRAHFNLPAGRSFARFWVTPPNDPTRIVAAT
jgi:hypothetical protein